MGEPIFLNDLIDSYYCNIGTKYRSSLRPGQIVWTYFLYNYENLEFWRPYSFDRTNTRAVSFEICSSVNGRFNRQTPLIVPRLEINEEFIKTFLRIYGRHESPSGFDDPRDSTFVGEWLNAHKGRLLRITIW